MRELPLDCFYVAEGSYLAELTGCKQDTSLAQIERRLDREDPSRQSQHQLDKQAKAARIELYRKQLEDSGEIEYDVDEDRLYRNEMAFVGYMVEHGLIDAKELESEPDEL
jgi:hypothetical protein